jgi:hypothetical protein
MSYRAAALLANPSRSMRDSWSLQASHSILTRRGYGAAGYGLVWQPWHGMAWQGEARPVGYGSSRQARCTRW